METVIRSADKGDIPGIIEVEGRAFNRIIKKGSSQWDRTYEKKLKTISHYRALEVEDKLIGLIKITPEWLKIGKARLLKGDVGEVSVLPEHQGKGYGGELMKDALAWMRENNYDLSRLGGLVRFYSRFGYHEFPRRYVEFFFPREIRAGRDRISFSDLFKKPPSCPHIRLFGKEDQPACLNLFNRFNMNRPGRPALAEMERHVKGLPGGDPLRVVYAEKGKVSGYLFASEREKDASEFEPRLNFEIAGNLEYPNVFRELLEYILSLAYKKKINRITARIPFDPQLAEIMKDVKVPFKFIELYETVASNMIRIIKLSSLFEHLLPELEYRFKNSLINWKGVLELDIGREKIQLSIQKAKIMSVEDKKPAWKFKLDEVILIKMVLGLISPSELTLPGEITSSQLSLLSVLFPHKSVYPGTWG